MHRWLGVRNLDRAGLCRPVKPRWLALFAAPVLPTSWRGACASAEVKTMASPTRGAVWSWHGAHAMAKPPRNPPTGTRPRGSPAGATM